MDRIAVAVGFFFLVIFSSTASIALDVMDKTDKDIFSQLDLSRNFPDPETESLGTIPHTSNEKTESEPANVVDKIPDAAAVESLSEPGIESVPLTIISFRPMERRFRYPGGTMTPLHRRHPCRHHRQLVKPWGPGFRSREVSYGDDMLIAGYKSVGADPMFRGGVRQIPARWVGFHPEGTRFPNLRSQGMRWTHLRNDEKREKEENHEEEEEHQHHHEESWFTGKVRKYLNQF